MEMTKKQLKELATSLDAYDLGGNVYDYENIIYYLDYRLDLKRLHEYNKKGLQELLKDLHKKYNINKFLMVEDDYKNDKQYKLSCKQLAYSHGTYGNNGQLHEIRVINDSDEVIYKYYIYYC